MLAEDRKKSRINISRHDLSVASQFMLCVRTSFVTNVWGLCFSVCSFVFSLEHKEWRSF